MSYFNNFSSQSGQQSNQQQQPQRQTSSMQYGQQQPQSSQSFSSSGGQSGAAGAPNSEWEAFFKQAVPNPNAGRSVSAAQSTSYGASNAGAAQPYGSNSQPSLGVRSGVPQQGYNPSYNQGAREYGANPGGGVGAGRVVYGGGDGGGFVRDVRDVRNSNPISISNLPPASYPSHGFAQRSPPYGAAGGMAGGMGAAMGGRGGGRVSGFAGEGMGAEGGGRVVDRVGYLSMDYGDEMGGDAGGGARMGGGFGAGRGGPGGRGGRGPMPMHMGGRGGGRGVGGMGTEDYEAFLYTDGNAGGSGTGGGGFRGNAGGGFGGREGAIMAGGGGAYVGATRQGNYTLGGGSGVYAPEEEDMMSYPAPAVYKEPYMGGGRGGGGRGMGRGRGGMGMAEYVPPSSRGGSGLMTRSIGKWGGFEDPVTYPITLAKGKAIGGVGMGGVVRSMGINLPYSTANSTSHAHANNSNMPPPARSQASGNVGRGAPMSGTEWGSGSVSGGKRGRERDDSPHSRSRSRSPRRRGRARGRGESPVSQSRSKRSGRSPPSHTPAKRAPSPKQAASNPPATTLTPAATSSEVAKRTTHTPSHTSFLHNQSLYDIFTKTNLPSINASLHTLTPFDLYIRFPHMYVPADYVHVHVHWGQVFSAYAEGYFRGLVQSTPILMESNPSVYVSPPHARSDSEDYVPFTPDIHLPAQFTYLHASIQNNTIVSERAQHHHRSPSELDTYNPINSLPVKFNVRVLIVTGLKDVVSERVDHTLLKKLRVIVGRKKNSTVCIGGVWSEDLDGGNPLLDRRCLLNTIRRCVYAQTLIDVTKDLGGLLCVGEVEYHRPEEVYKDKSYPEQMEVSSLYVYTVQPSMLHGLQNVQENNANGYEHSDVHHPHDHDGHSSDFDVMWEVFEGRVRGTHPGPLMHRRPEDFPGDFSRDKRQRSGDYPADLGGRDESAEVGLEEKEAGDAQEAEGHDKASVGEEAVPDGDQVEDQKVEPAVTVDGGEGDKSTASTQPPLKSAGKPAQASVPKIVVSKPSSPHLLVAPMPTVAEDGSGGLALRMVTLSSLLAYSAQDKSERVFEASLIAEMLRAIITVDYATTICDILLSEDQNLGYMINDRVRASVRKLRQLNAAVKAKMGVQGKKEGTGKANAKAESKQSEGEQSSAGAEEVQVKIEEEEDKAIDDDLAKADENQEAQEEGVGGETMQMAEDGGDGVAEEQRGEGEVAGESESKGDGDWQNELEVSEEEARQVRRHFIHACRWFDINQEHTLRTDQLINILLVSARRLSRVDYAAVAEEACGENERLRYETYL